MKIVTKVGAGYGMLIVLIFGVLAYQFSLIYQMQVINRDLAHISFLAGQTSLRLMRDLDQTEEFTQKSFVSDYAGYRTRLKETCDSVSSDLAELRKMRLSPAEQHEVDQLTALWQRFLQARKAEAAEADQVALLGAARVETQGLINATGKTIDAQVGASAETGHRAMTIAWGAAGASLLVSLLVSAWIVRSISRPLRNLTDATRAVASGKFIQQLETPGDDELTELAHDFNTMTRRLGELDQLKKDFVSHVSHELKGPLASLRESMRLLLDGIPGTLTDKQRRLLELNLQSAQRLTSMIGNLLDLGRMEAGVMQYTMGRNDLSEVVRGALAEFEVQLREKHLHFETDLPDHAMLVECDRDRMTQVIGNLLGNALKFSPAGSAIRVSLRHIEETLQRGMVSPEGFALISIADSGPGIPASERQNIFEKFRQVRKDGRVPNPGTGLGLAIGRTIVEAHGGAIWVEDNSEGGSIFHVLLAAGARAGAAAPVSRPI